MTKRRRQRNRFSRWGPQNQDVDYRGAAQDMDYRDTSSKSHSGRPIAVTVCYGERKTNRRQNEVQLLNNKACRDRYQIVDSTLWSQSIKNKIDHYDEPNS